MCTGTQELVVGRHVDTGVGFSQVLLLKIPKSGKLQIWSTEAMLCR